MRHDLISNLIITTTNEQKWVDKSYISYQYYLSWSTLHEQWKRVGGGWGGAGGGAGGGEYEEEKTVKKGVNDKYRR